MDGTPHVIICGIIAVFVAGVIKGLTGFGFSLAAVPILVLLLGPRTAIPIVIVLNALTNIGLYLSVRESADLRRIRPLIIAGIVSVPPGMALLLVLNASVLKAIIGCAICAFALAFLLGFKRRVRNEKRGLVVAGLVSGTLNGAISTGGPPVILFLSNQGDAKHPFRANLIAYFLFLSLASVPIFIAGGLVTFRVTRYALIFFPGLILGALAGNWILHRVPEKTFRMIALLVVLAAGVIAVLSSTGLM
jgi:uncharacterized membrane protein YfcA